MPRSSVKKDRARTLDMAVAQIQRQFGEGAIMRMGEGRPIRPVETISTGTLSLDAALGVGGVPRGRVIEIYGPEASGKTTLALHIMAESQKAGGIAAFIDAEHALDSAWASKLGVNIDQLLIAQPTTGEEGLEITDTLVRSGSVDTIVVDSVAALVPRAELDDEMGDHHVGLQARLMSQAMRKLTGTMARSRTSVVFINQTRMKIGVMFGNPETTTGGMALKFYASVRMQIKRIGSVKDGDEVVGNRTQVRVVKNKIAPPFREAEFDIMYDEGISKYGDMLDLGVTYKLIQKAGAWYSYNDERVGQGRENAKQYLKAHPDVAAELEGQLRETLGIAASAQSGDGQDANES